WFFSTATLDQAITDVKINGDSTLITVENKGGLIMPVTAKMYERNGDSAVVKLPIEIWQRGSSWTFQFIAKSPVQRIVLDPEQLLPDTNRINNQWTAGKK